MPRASKVVPHPLSKTKKLAFIILANLLVFGVAFVSAELILRAKYRSESSEATWLVADPDLGYKLNPDVERFHSLGFLYEEIAREKPNRLFRTIVLGDSLSFGNSGFVTMLRERFGELRDGPVEVINASIPGYTTYQERILLQRDLLVFKPDLVILQYCLNDNHRFLHELDESSHWLLTAEARRALLPPGDGLLARAQRSSYAVIYLRKQLFAIASGGSSVFTWKTNGAFGAAWLDHTWPDLEEQLRMIRDSLNEIGSRFAVVAVPYEPQLNQAALDADAEYTTKPQRKLKEACERLNVPLLDLYPAFLENRDRRLFSTDGIHLRPLGHEIAGEQLLNWLREKELAR